MNINVGIIDQYLTGLATRLRSKIEGYLDKKLDDTALRSLGFVVLCAKIMLDLEEEEAVEALCDGGNDLGVDAIWVGDVGDNEFSVTLLQGKYHHANL